MRMQIADNPGFPNDKVGGNSQVEYTTYYYSTLFNYYSNNLLTLFDENNN